MTQTTNKLAAMFNIDVVKKMIASCPNDEIVILCGNWSINKPEYSDEEIDNYDEQGDWDEMEEMIGEMLFVNDYNDLCCDPHGVLSE